MSSTDQTPNLPQHLLTGNGFDLTGPNLVSPTDSFHGPQTANLVGFRQIQTFDKSVSQQCS